jgi:hypothetical protein
MKKSIIALVALSGVAGAFTDTVWDFENSTATTSGVQNDGAFKPADGTATYTATGLTVGTKIGDYTLNKDLGSAIDLTSSQWTTTAGSAYWGNGAGYVRFGQNGQSFTLITYVKFDSIGGEQFIFGTGSGNASGVAFGINGGKLDLLAKGVAHHELTGSYTLAADVWYNLAVSYDQSTGEAAFYINGESVGSLTGLNAVTCHDGGGAASAFGSASSDSLQGAFAGEIAQFQILSGAKTQAEILTASNLVPEPATATLSLLALVGLAVRRRRK